MTSIFVSIRDRARCTKACVDSLINTAGAACIHLFDNDSGDEFDELMDLYHFWFRRGQIASLTLNQFNGRPEVYWSKNYAWAQFLASIRAMENKPKYLVMVDNDIVARPGWLENSIRVLESEEAEMNNILFVSPYDGPPDPQSNPETYVNLDVLCIADHTLEVRNAVTSRLWVAKTETWLQWPAPTYQKIMREGKPDRMPTDWHYWKKAQSVNGVFAVFRPRLAVDPPFPWRSSRMDNSIGDDCSK